MFISALSATSTIHIYIDHALPARQPARWLLTGKRWSATRVTAAAMRPSDGSAVKTPCPGGVFPWTITPAAIQASGTRLLALQRAIGVGYANDVPRAGAHYCTNARSPSSPFPHRCFRVLSMLFGQPMQPAITAALVSRSGFAAASDDTPQWSLRLPVGTGGLERSAHQKNWCLTTLLFAKAAPGQASPPPLSWSMLRPYPGGRGQRL